MWVGILILIGWLLYSVLKAVIEDKKAERLREEKRKEEAQKKEEALRKESALAEARRQKEQLLEWLNKKYPVGVELFKKQNPSATLFDIVSNETKIKSLDIVGREYNLFITWSLRQKAYAERSRRLSPDAWGCYYYDIRLVGVDEEGRDSFYTFKIWQHFKRSYCRDESLDYSSFPSRKKTLESLSKFKQNARYFSSSVYDEVLHIIEELSNNIVVLFSGSGNSSDVTAYTDSLNYHQFDYLRSELDKRGIRYWEIGYDEFYLDEKQDIVIVELDTNNTRLRQICETVFLQNKAKKPCITYISLFKEYSSEEMSELIDERKAELREEKARAERQAEIARAAEERKRREAENRRKITSSLKEAASSWERVPYSDIPHTFCIRYYPTTCEFDATDDEWNDRQLIWSFKNDPNKRTRIPHDEALDELMPWVEEELKDTFGDLLSNLTLVCIPASTPAKNKARYELFANLICESTGMTNAFSYMTINEERVARHEGGVAGETDYISFDEEFFKGKNILLFDDLLTRGDSMRKFGRKMSSLGANVIASMTIGKTFHTREDEESRGTQGRYVDASDDDDDDDENFPF